MGKRLIEVFAEEENRVLRQVIEEILKPLVEELRNYGEEGTDYLVDEYEERVEKLAVKARDHEYLILREIGLTP
jgi:hypothetical protein